MMLMVVFLTACNMQKHIIENHQEEETTNVVTTVKIVEYDTVRYICKDTIIQPVKKITYINQNVDKAYKEQDEIVEDKKTTTSIWGYVIAFGIGVVVMVVLILVLKIWLHI